MPDSPHPGNISPSPSDRLCPSARCEKDAILLGIVGPDGVVGYVTPQMRIDLEFVNQAHQGRVPEKRFRFSQPCVEDGCRHWTGTHCGVIQRVLKETEATRLGETSSESLPKCSIRAHCRWFGQEGPAACQVCPYVITDRWPE